jgi:tRNA(fMet)-specific endonuclease VapC
MSYLPNRDTCAGLLRGRQVVAARFAQHSGKLHASALTILSLEMWLLRRSTPGRLLNSDQTVLQQVRVVNVDDAVAHQAARLSTQLRRQGQRLGTVNLVLAATALVHGFTLVTHATASFSNVPALSLADWLVP